MNIKDIETENVTLLISKGRIFPEGYSGDDPPKGDYTECQETCPNCNSNDFGNDDAPNDLNLNEISCYGCGYQWQEPQENA